LWEQLFGTTRETEPAIAVRREKPFGSDKEKNGERFPSKENGSPFFYNKEIIDSKLSRLSEMQGVG